MRPYFGPHLASDPDSGLKSIACTPNGTYRAGQDGVEAVLESRDGQYTFLCYADKTMVRLHSGGIYETYYPLPDPVFEAPARYVLMDLDGTSINSEHFWVWIIQQSIARLMGNPNFCLEDADMPYVSGYSVTEHLRYCIQKYCPDGSLQAARGFYKELVDQELTLLTRGMGRTDAFQPMDGLLDFIQELKNRNIKIALVSSGSRFKVQAELAAVCKQMGIASEEELYDCVITGGIAPQRGELGTISELAAKPHPWLYAEAAQSGLGLSASDYPKVIGLDDSAAGVVALRLAGFDVIGMDGGNIAASGVAPLVRKNCRCLMDALPIILGE